MSLRNWLLLLLLFTPGWAFGGASSRCDVNQDGVQDVKDVQMLINEALGRNAAVDDVNQDGAVNAADVQIVLNAALQLGCTVGASGPQVTISDFNPKSGPIGTLIALTGTNFGSAPQISMPKQGGGALTQPLTAASATSASFVIAAGTATGAITVTNGSLAGATATSFAVTPSSTFSLTASPSTASLILGQSTAVAVQLTSGGGTNFTALATLSVSGLPSGVTASFKPAAITAGQTSILTLQVPAGQTTSTSALTIGAAATVEGIAMNQTSPVALSVVAPTTSFLGRTVVDDAAETPLAGVTVSTMGLDGSGGTTGCTGHTVVSDAAGNFVLINLPSSCIGPQMISFNGNTVTSPPGKYAGVNLVFTLVTGQVVVSPVLVHMPRSDNLETYQVTQNASADQTFVFKSIPGLSVTIYAGTTLTAADGSQPNPYPFSAVAIPIDRLPDQMPLTNSMVTPFIVSFPPDGTSTNQPVAVWYPNTLNTPPGTSVVLMTLDPTRGRMVAYGTGAISNDGSTIVPDADPNSGSLHHRFGISHFDWHGPAVNPPPGISIPCGCENGESGDPIDLASGMQTWTSTDLTLDGGRGGLVIQRAYRGGSTQNLSFGIGQGFNYDYRLNPVPQGVANVDLQMPNGSVVPFVAQSDGTFTNSTVPDFAGAVLTPNNDGTSVLRLRTGSYLKFYGTVISAIGDPTGNQITVNYVPGNPEALISDIDDAAGRKFIFTYNTYFTYPAIASITDPIGRAVSYTYNSAGYLATYTDVLGGVTKYDYDVQNRLVKVTDPRGVVQMQDTYDANGRVISQTLPSGGMFHYAYTLTNALVPTSPVTQTVVTDPLGNTATYRFNSQGYVVSVTDALGQTRTLNRAPGTNLLTGLSGAGACDVCGNHQSGDITFGYDANGNMTSRTDALGHTWQYTYDPVFNQITSATDPLGNTNTFLYDAHGNLIQTTDARGKSIVYQRDLNGLVTSATDESGAVTKFTYNGVGDMVTLTGPAGDITQFTYDGVSRMTAEMDPLGHVSTVVYNAAGQPMQMTDATGATLKFTYDIGGYIQQTTDSNGGAKVYAYDAAGRLTSKTDPLNRMKKFTYDLNNNVVSMTNRRGQTVTLAYDPLNRPVAETFPDASIQLVYDTYGRTTRVVDSQSGTFDMQYDPVGHLIRKSGPNGTITYTRDAGEMVTSRQVQGQPAATYTYDPNQNLLTASMGSVSTSRTYDARNSVTQATRSNGVTTSYTFDPVGRLLSLTNVKGASTLFSRNFNYDSNGNIVGAAVDSGKPLATPAAAGSFDSADEISSFGGTTYTSDADGNRLTETSAAGQTAYHWDSRGRLQSIVTPAGVTTSFQYEPDGSLIQQQVSASGQNTTQSLVWDDAGNIVSIQQGQSVISVLDGRAMDDIVAVSKGGIPVLPLADQVGSEGVLTDPTGSVVGRAYFEPFGAATSTGTAGEFLYAGHPAVNGNLYYNRARFYDGNTGRFLSEDPAGAGGGSRNLYRYADNNPIGESDASGLDVWVEHGQPDQIPGGAGHAHQKICVGTFALDKRGQNQASCYSFGLTRDGVSGLNPFGGDGRVDADNDRSMKIVKGLYHTTTPQQDKQIKAVLAGVDGMHAPYWIIGSNCINFAKSAFDDIVQTGGLPPDFHPYTGWEDVKRAEKFALQTEYQMFRTGVPGGLLLPAWNQ